MWWCHSKALEEWCSLQGKYAFGWRLLLQKLLTRAALNHRGILLNPLDLPCIFAFALVKIVPIFSSCVLSPKAYGKMYDHGA
jgi:hypothetical protein